MVLGSKGKWRTPVNLNLGIERIACVIGHCAATMLIPPRLIVRPSRLFSSLLPPAPLPSLHPSGICPSCIGVPCFPASRRFASSDTSHLFADSAQAEAYAAYRSVTCHTVCLATACTGSWECPQACRLFPQRSARLLVSFLGGFCFRYGAL